MPTALDRIGDRSRRTVAKSRTRRKTLIVERVYLPAFKNRRLIDRRDRGVFVRQRWRLLRRFVARHCQSRDSRTS